MLSLLFVVLALVAGVPEAGEASQSEPSAVSDPQGVADSYLRRSGDLTPGGLPGGVAVRPLFHSADDQMADYSTHWSARSSDTSVVTVTLGRDPEPVPAPRLPDLKVWIWPVGTGEATVTVSYTEDGSSVSASFTVTVVDPAPVDGGDDPPDSSDPYAVPDPQGNADGYLGALQVSGGPEWIPARSLIVANDQMADYSAYWSVRSSDTGVVTVALGRHPEPVPAPRRAELLVWILPVGNGEASVTVGYSRHGKSATAKFTVRVGAAGGDDAVGPVANVQAVVNDEVDQAGGLAPGGRAVTIDVNDLFVNVGRGAAGRDFSARSSDGRVVTVEVTDNPHVVIRPVGDGTATVTVRYTGGGRSVSASFGVAVGEGFAPPVPTLPLAAAGLLAALLYGAGLRRSRRRL